MSGSDLYEKQFEVRWSDCDANRHMRHTAYADMCAHARVSFLASIGLTPEWFKEHDMGPVLFKEETEYRSEVHMGEVLRVTVERAEPSGFSKSVRLIQKVYKSSGDLSAIHCCVVGWMSLEMRKIVDLPEQIIGTITQPEQKNLAAV
jgi:acyl-CoA thioester hydrolase